jgi:stalled ribosome rescue protein Dom34
MINTNVTNNGGSLKAETGLWVDHREACIVVLSKTGQETKWIHSNEESQLRRSGEPSTGRFEYQHVPADDSRQREYTGHLARYYAEIISHLRDAGVVLIFGPGEAKGELKKRFEKEKPGIQLVTVETADKMSESQIVTYIRHHFDHDAARQAV